MKSESIYHNIHYRARFLLNIKQLDLSGLICPPYISENMLYNIVLQHTDILGYCLFLFGFNKRKHYLYRLNAVDK